MVTVQPFEYLLFCAIIIHLCAITSESGRRSHSEAAYVLDIIILCFYLCAPFPCLSTANPRRDNAVSMILRSSEGEEGLQWMLVRMCVRG